MRCRNRAWIFLPISQMFLFQRCWCSCYVGRAVNKHGRMKGSIGGLRAVLSVNLWIFSSFMKLYTFGRNFVVSLPYELCDWNVTFRNCVNNYSVRIKCNFELWLKLYIILFTSVFFYKSDTLVAILIITRPRLAPWHTKY